MMRVAWGWIDEAGGGGELRRQGAEKAWSGGGREERLQ